MIAQQVAKKYSTALFRLVREKGLIDIADEQFGGLDDLIKRDESLLQFLLAPHILDQRKVALVRDVFGPRLEPLFLEFIMVLIEKHRIGYLHQIIEALRALVDEERGIIEAQVTTAVPMTDEIRQRLIGRLARKTGKTIELKEKVDAAILGGMIVILRDQIIDGSISHNLALLKEELMKLKVA